MKALSIWQPWAWLIAAGQKRIETRCWSTLYRGPLLIHAGKTQDYTCNFEYLLNTGALPEGLRPEYHFGKIIAVARLCSVVPTESVRFKTLTHFFPPDQSCAFAPEREKSMGDYSAGRFGWCLTDVKPLATPIPYTGRQRLFDVPDEILPAGVRNG